MDWAGVSLQELVVALREVDWNQKPRPPAEFFTRFTPPKTKTKWASRLKCNAYYYRVNYVVLVVLCFVIAFVRRPLAFVAVGAATFTTLCLNDSFSHSVSERVVRLARRVHPPLASKLRNPQATNAPAGRPYARSRVVYMCGQDRRVVLGGMYAVSLLLMWVSAAVRTVCGTAAIAAVLVGAHATFRSPNLKARLSSVNEEFRAVWRGYNEL